jgi:hypothetical protein
MSVLVRKLCKGPLCQKHDVYGKCKMILCVCVWERERERVGGGEKCLLALFMVCNFHAFWRWKARWHIVKHVQSDRNKREVTLRSKNLWYFFLLMIKLVVVVLLEYQPSPLLNKTCEKDWHFYVTEWFGQHQGTPVFFISWKWNHAITGFKITMLLCYVGLQILLLAGFFCVVILCKIQHWN